MAEAPPGARRFPGSRLLRSRFLRDSAVLQAGSLGIAGSNFLGAVILTHVLGASELGVFYLAVAAHSLLWGLLNLGLSSVTASEVAAGTGQGDLQRVTRWLAALLRLGGVFALIAIPAGWFVVRPLASDFYGPRVGLLAAFLAAGPLLELLRTLVAAALQGTRRMAALARVDVGLEMTRVVLVIAGALVTGDAVGPVIGTLAATGLGTLIALDLYRQERRAGTPLPSLGGVVRASDVPARDALRQGLQVGFVRNVDALSVQTLPALIMGYFGAEAWVAYLRIAQRLVAVASQLMQGINRTALPAMAGLAGVRDAVGLRRVYWQASLLSGVTISTGLLLTLPLLPLLVRTVFPPDFHDPVWTICLILVPGVMIVSFSVANDVFYLVTRQMRVAMALSLVGFLVNPPMVALFARWKPTIGVAIGLSVTCLWSLVHVAYAGTWLARNVREGGVPERDATGMNPAPPVGR